MFYRRKIILTLLQLFDGSLEKIRLHKLLFLYSKGKNNPEYEFIPYKYGSYSYSANADLITMVKKKYLTEKDNLYTKLEEKDYSKEIKPADMLLLREILTTYGHMSNDSLIKHTYINFPFYATKSKIAKGLLSKESYKKVLRATPVQKDKVMFTLGYQGISLENYLNKLVRNNVKLLVDVRKNPLSQKYGFSKTLLKRYCESLNIDYIHIPEVGINSNLRKSLQNQSDYDALFEDYKKTTLKESVKSQGDILKLLDNYNRIALTCFEAEICQCHRLHLSESLKERRPELSIHHI